MEYNTTRGPLKMAEYGRNIQKMVEYIIQIPDREERTRAAQALVKCMEQITPEQKDYTDYKRKLWDHLHIISDFRLDVDATYPLPSKEQVELKPQPIPYSDNKIKYRHYGRNVQKMIDYVSTLDTDHPDRKAMIRVIGNSMKMAYLTWNSDNVADDVILEQMKELSDGKIDTEGIKLAPTNELLQIIRQQQKLQPVAKPGNKKKRKHK